LILDGSTLYGMTKKGGDDDLGVIFKVDTAGTGFTLLHEFAGWVDDGSGPFGSLTLDGAALYGMTSQGGGNGTGVIFSVSLSADLSVTKTDSPDPVTAGSELTYTLTVQNSGPADAPNVVLTDSVPAGIQNPQYVVDGGGSWSNWTGSVSLGTLNNGDSRQVQIRGTVAVPAGESLENSATVSSDAADPDSTDNDTGIIATSVVASTPPPSYPVSPPPPSAGEVVNNCTASLGRIAGESLDPDAVPETMAEAQGLLSDGLEAAVAGFDQGIWDTVWEPLDQLLGLSGEVLRHGVEAGCGGEGASADERLDCMGRVAAAGTGMFSDVLDQLAAHGAFGELDVAGALSRAAGVLQGEAAQVGESLSGGMSELSGEDPTVGAVRELVDRVGDVADVFLERDIPLSADLAGALADVADTALELVWDSLAENAGVDPGPGPNAATLAGSPTHLLDGALDVAGVDVTDGMAVEVVSETVAEEAGELWRRLGLEDTIGREEFVAGVAAGQPGVGDPGKGILFRGVAGAPARLQSAAQSQEEAALRPVEVMQNALSAAGLVLPLQVVSRDLGLVGFPISDDPGGSEVEGSVYFQETHLVPGVMPEGVYLMPRGSLLTVANGVGLRVAPAPHEPVSLVATLLGSWARGVLGGPVALSTGGRLSIDTPGGALVAALSYLVTAENTLAAGVTSFDLQGTDPAGEAYQVLIHYNDGTRQGLHPVISELGALGLHLDRLAPGGWRIDSLSGILEVQGLGRWKADYAVEELTGAQQVWYEAHRDPVSQLAFRGEDANADGRMDLWVYGAAGRQVLYRLP
jgi:uncharacterized repeat protein (TIGR01451 family)